MCWEKYRKVQNFFCSNKRRSKKTDEDRNKSVVTISPKIRFIDSARFTTSSLSNLAENPLEEIHKFNCIDCDCFLEYERSRMI